MDRLLSICLPGWSRVLTSFAWCAAPRAVTTETAPMSRWSSVQWARLDRRATAGALALRDLKDYRARLDLLEHRDRKVRPEHPGLLAPKVRWDQAARWGLRA